MALKTVYVVQPFEVRLKTKHLAPLPKVKARSEAHARYQAEQIAARKAGAAVVALTLDTASGHVSSARILARFGNVPDDLEQIIQGD